MYEIVYRYKHTSKHTHTHTHTHTHILVWEKFRRGRGSVSGVARFFCRVHALFEQITLELYIKREIINQNNKQSKYQNHYIEQVSPPRSAFYSVVCIKSTTRSLLYTFSRTYHPAAAATTTESKKLKTQHPFIRKGERGFFSITAISIPPVLFV